MTNINKEHLLRRGVSFLYSSLLAEAGTMGDKATYAMNAPWCKPIRELHERGAMMRVASKDKAKILPRNNKTNSLCTRSHISRIWNGFKNFWFFLRLLEKFFLT